MISLPHPEPTLFGPDGVAGAYRQVHVHPDDRGWCSAGDAFAAFDLPFGTVGLMCGYDGIFPESPRILARMGADLIVYPTTWREHWEATLGVIERCSENHVSIVAAARPDSPVGEASMILALPKEYLFPITGEVNVPHRMVATSRRQTVSGTLDLTLSRDKLLMGQTDLIMYARPELYSELTASRQPVRVGGRAR